MRVDLTKRLTGAFRHLYRLTMRAQFHGILHADNHDIVRLGVKALLNRIMPTVVVNEIKEMVSLPHKLRQLQPDLLILECGESPRDSLILVRETLNNFPRTQILIFTRYTGGQFLRRIIQIGVHGVVLKSDQHDHFEAALGMLSCGNHYYSPGVLAKVSKTRKSVAEPQPDEH